MQRLPVVTSEELLVSSFSLLLGEAGNRGFLVVPFSLCFLPTRSCNKMSVIKIIDLLEKPWYLTYWTNFASSIEPECSLRRSKNPSTQTPCVTFNIMLNFFYGDFLLPSIHRLNPRTTLKVNKKKLLFHCYTNLHTIESRDCHFKYRIYVFPDMITGTLGRGRKQEHNGDNYVTRSFIVCTFRKYYIRVNKYRAIRGARHVAHKRKIEKIYI